MASVVLAAAAAGGSAADGEAFWLLRKERIRESDVSFHIILSE